MRRRIAFSAGGSTSTACGVTRTLGAYIATIPSASASVASRIVAVIGITTTSYSGPEGGDCHLLQGFSRPTGDLRPATGEIEGVNGLSLDKNTLKSYNTY